MLLVSISAHQRGAEEKLVWKKVSLLKEKKIIKKPLNHLSLLIHTHRQRQEGQHQHFRISCEVQQQRADPLRAQSRAARHPTLGNLLHLPASDF